MGTFTEQEAAFLGADGVGRLATLSRDGAPALAAIRYQVRENNDGTTEIVIPGFGMKHSAKFHNVGRDGRVAFLVDGPGTGSGRSVQFIQIRGSASTESDDEGDRIVIKPERIISFNVNQEYSDAHESEYDTRVVGGERTLRRVQA